MKNFKKKLTEEYDGLGAFLTASALFVFTVAIIAVFVVAIIKLV